MSSWFGSSSGHKEKKAAATPPVAKGGTAVPPEWPCACEHCYGIISKLPPPPPPPQPSGSSLTSSGPADHKKPTWQAAGKLLGSLPGAYTRYPFLEQYAENVLNLRRDQVLRLRVQDIKMVLQQKRIVVPELFDYPLEDYEGPRELPASVSNAPATVTTTTTPGPMTTPAVDVDLLVTRLTEALSEQKKRQKKDKKRRHRRHRHQKEEQEHDEGEEQEDGAQEVEEEEEEEQEEQQEEQGRKGGGRRR